MSAGRAPSVREEPERGANHVDVKTVSSPADPMPSDDELLRGLIRQAISGRPDAYAEVSLALLQSLAAPLSQIIGAEGFGSLLLRIAHRVSNEHPWFQFGPDTLPRDPQFAALRTCFQGQEPDEARAASLLFFGDFIDVLTSLIGAHLTTLILKSALGGASAATSSKEQNDE